MVRGWVKFILVSIALPSFMAGCAWVEPGIMEDDSHKELEGPGLLTGKRGGIVIYQR
jgi:hypothetical protein